MLTTEASQSFPATTPPPAPPLSRAPPSPAGPPSRARASAAPAAPARAPSHPPLANAPLPMVLVKRCRPRFCRGARITSRFIQATRLLYRVTQDQRAYLGPVPRVAMKKTIASRSSSVSLGVSQVWLRARSSVRELTTGFVAGSLVDTCSMTSSPTCIARPPETPSLLEAGRGG